MSLILKNIYICQLKYLDLCRKYEQAKRLIQSLREAENLLTEQLLTRDEHYSHHLGHLRERVLTLEAELIETQKAAHFPIRLPYDPEEARQLLSPPEILKRQPVRLRIILKLELSTLTVSKRQRHKGNGLLKAMA